MRIGEIAKNVLEQHGCTSVCAGDLVLLHEISKAAGHAQNRHPLKKLASVMNALDRDTKKPGSAMTMYWGRWSYGNRVCRGFWIAGTEPEEWRNP